MPRHVWAMVFVCAVVLFGSMAAGRTFGPDAETYLLRLAFTTTLAVAVAAWHSARRYRAAFTQLYYGDRYRDRTEHP